LFGSFTNILYLRKFEKLLNPGELGKLTLIVAVMLPEALAFEAEPQHLSG